VFIAQLLEVGKAGHVAVGLDHLDDRRRGMKSGKFAEINRTFGLTGLAGD
jgi:hypothetical protein